MVSAEKVLKIKLKAVADISDVKANLGTLQDIIKKLEVGPETKGEFNRIFTDLERNINKASSLLDSKFAGKGAYSAFEKSIGQINVLMNELGSSMTSLPTSVLQKSINLDTEPIKAARREVEGLRAELEKETTSAFDLKAIRAMAQKMNAAGLAPKITGTGGENYIGRAFETGNLPDIQKAIRSLELGQRSVKDDSKKALFDEGIELFKGSLNALSDTRLDDLKVKFEAAKEAAAALASTVSDEVAEKLRSLTGEDFAEFIRGALGATDTMAGMGRATQNAKDQLQQLKSQALYFFGAVNGVRLFKRAVQAAFRSVKELDSSMTQTAVVTDYTIKDLWRQLPEYTKRANQLGVSILAAYDADRIYYQQGLAKDAVKGLSEETLKMARIAGLDAVVATDRMTNSLRGFNMELDKTSAQKVSDVYSELAAITAADVDEISNAMTKVASLAYTANMSFENTAAFLTQIIETTRESSETAGTSLKTVIARFSEAKKLYSMGELLGVDAEGEEIDVNRISTALRTVGIDLNKYFAGVTGLDEAFIELASKWESLEPIQKRYIATMAAGSRQQARFLALMSDYGRMQQLVTAANTADGAANEQYQKTLDSMETSLTRLTNATNEFVMGITNATAAKGIVNTLTEIISAFNKMTKGTTEAGSSVVKLAVAFAGLRTVGRVVDRTFERMGDKLLGRAAPKKITWAERKRASGGSLQALFGRGPTTKQELDELVKKREEYSEKQAQINEKWDQKQAQLKQEYDNSYLTRSVILAEKDYKKQKPQLEKERKKELRDLRKKSPSAQMEPDLAKLGVVMAGLGLAIQKLNGSIRPNLLTDFSSSLVQLGLILPAVSAGLNLLGKTVTMSLGKLGIFIGAITAVVTVLKYLARAIETPKEKLDRLSTEAEDAKTSADGAAGAFRNLTSALEELSTKQLNLASLIVGTDEWRDSVQSLNQEILELIDKYPKLRGALTQKDGVLQLDEKIQEDVLKEYEQAADMAQMYSSVAQLAEKQYEARLRTEEMSATYGRSYLDEQGEHYLYVAPEAIEEAAKVLAGDAATLSKYEGTPEEIAEKILSAADARVENIDYDALEAHGQTLIANQAQQEGFYAQALSSILTSDKVKGLTSEGRKAATELISPQKIEELIAAQISESVPKLSNDEQKKFLEGELLATDIEETETGWSFKLGDTQAQKTTEDVNKLASAWDELDAIATTAVATADYILKNSDSDFAKVFGRKEGGALTQQDLLRLGGEEAAKAAAETWEKLPGKVKAAYDDGKEIFIRQFEENIGFARKSFEISDTVPESISDLFEGDAAQFTNLQAGTQKDLVEKFSLVFANAGDEGVEELAGKLSELGSELGETDFAKLLEILSNTSWQNLRDLETLPSVFSEMGIASSDLTDSLLQMIAEIVGATNIISGATAKKRLMGLYNVRKEIDEGKTTFSEELYKEIVKSAPELTSSFKLMLDGNYAYVGALDDLTGALEKNTSEALQSSIAQTTARISAAELYNAQRFETPNRENFFSQLLKATDGDLSKLGIEGFGKDTTFDEASENWDALMDGLKANAENLPELQDELKSFAHTAASLDIQSQDHFDAKTTIAANVKNLKLVKAYTDGLSAEAAAYGVSAEAIKEYEEAIANAAKEEDRLTAIQDYAGVIGAFKDAQKWGISSEQLEAQAQALKLNKEYSEGLSDALIYQAAENLLRELDAIEEAEGKWEDFNNTLFKSGEGLDTIRSKLDIGGEAYTHIESFKGVVEQLLGLSHKLPDNFFDIKNMRLANAALQGNEDAIHDLQIAALEWRKNAILGDESELTIDSAQKEAIENYYEALDTLRTADPGDTQFQSYIDNLNTYAQQAGISAEQINADLGAIGYDADVQMKEVDFSADAPVADIDYGSTGTGVKAVTKTRTEHVPGKMYVPTIGQVGKTSARGSVGARPKKGGGGGGGKSKTWQNPYDKLFNLQQRTNAALKERERLERGYDRILKGRTSTAEVLRQNSLDQIENLRREIDLQEQLARGRKQQIAELGSRKFQTEDGSLKTFASLGVTRYGQYDEASRSLVIDWQGLEAITDTDTGNAAKAYIDKLKELSDSFNETSETIEKMYDTIQEIRDYNKSEYLEFEQRIYDALVESDQKLIDEYQKIAGTIENSNERILRGLQDSVELSREIRDNTETEKDIAEKEARLAFLKRDTSGANLLEIKELEKELGKARQNYQDARIDQSIERLQKDNELAAEQRADQINIMQAQLDYAKETGFYWEGVYDLISTAFNPDGTLNNNAGLVALLRESDTFKGLSFFGQMNWINEMAQEWIKAQEGLSNWRLEEAENRGSVILKDGTELTFDSDKKTWRDAGGAEWGNVAWREEIQGFTGIKRPPMIVIQDSTTSAAPPASAASSTSSWGGPPPPEDWQTKDWRFISGKWSQFATGGLADFTGPAWLDGTKTKPELVLNADDTQNFIQLKNLLAAQGVPSAKPSTMYYDIDISADISSDYDVSRLAEQIKRELSRTASYRNVNLINYMK